MRTSLYRHYDKTGTLLYVGVSLNPIMRTSQHASHSDWRDDIARIEIQWFPTSFLARTAEKLAIRKETPIHNKARPWITKKPRRLAKLLLAEKRLNKPAKSKPLKVVKPIDRKAQILENQRDYSQKMTEIDKRYDLNSLPQNTQSEINHYYSQWTERMKEVRMLGDEYRGRI